MFTLKVLIFIFFYTQPSFTCSKSTETLEKGEKYMFRINNKTLNFEHISDLEH